LKILFFMRHRGYVRNFESTLVGLTERGHEVVVALGDVATPWLGNAPATSHPLADSCPAVQFRSAPRARGLATILGRRLRVARDYLRYLSPAYDHAEPLRVRARGKAPLSVRGLVHVPGIRSPSGLAKLDRTLGWLEGRLPRPKAIDRFLADEAPDAVLVTPLIELGSPQTAIVRASRAAGIPVGLCVASWDNLTNKGGIREELDLVAVWNEAQRREAIELHGVSPERVVATGANAYDHWFEWEPTTSREEFCASVGLPADRPFVLYVGSSRFIAPNETPFVRRWLQSLRSDEALRDVGVLIRPHPQNATQWEEFDVGAFADVAIRPRAGQDPVDRGAKSFFYDSIHHSAGVVGINTSALIESAIVGRTVYTLALPEVSRGQEGTLHFRHLVQAGGGVLEVAHSFEEHAAQLQRGLEAPEATGRNKAFLEAFVRPFGLDTPAAPRLIEAIEQLAGATASPAADGAAAKGIVRAR
jgi:hypothetical protein